MAWAARVISSEKNRLARLVFRQRMTGKIEAEDLFLHEEAFSLFEIR